MANTDLRCVICGSADYPEPKLWSHLRARHSTKWVIDALVRLTIESRPDQIGRAHRSILTKAQPIQADDSPHDVTTCILCRLSEKAEAQK